MNSEAQPQITAQLTPNPNTIRFAVDREFFKQGSCNFPDRGKAYDSPLACVLFEIPSVEGVMLGPDFVSVTKSQNADWQALLPPVIERLKAFLSSGEPAIADSLIPSAEEHKQDTVAGDAQHDIEMKIREILDQEIRPAVARDGGDIVFYGFQDGVVQLHLQGACSSCPSSIMTLKLGIENRLKQSIPEVREVLQV